MAENKGKKAQKNDWKPATGETNATENEKIKYSICVWSVLTTLASLIYTAASGEEDNFEVKVTGCFFHLTFCGQLSEPSTLVVQKRKQTNAGETEIRGRTTEQMYIHFV